MVIFTLFHFLQRKKPRSTWAYILQNQREILSHLGVLTKELKGLRTDIDNKRDEVKEPVSVPNRIRVGICLLF